MDKDHGSPIETAAGLYEAVYDVALDETPGWFMVAWMLHRLPYGQRTRNAIDRLVRNGKLRRFNKGAYKIVGPHGRGESLLNAE